jgi:cellulose synthase/poly-beta-1,6-N-acetylglucosamine synthase-like glycosyltransferase
MRLIEIIFFVGLLTIFYSYVGYGLLLWVCIKIKNLAKSTKQEDEVDFLPSTTLVIAAYNEEDFIEKKIQNSLSLDYPEDKLEIIFITDGSTDNSSLIVSRFPRIRLLHKPERRGKVAAMHRAMSYITTPFVIFSDANTLLNREAVRNIVRHYKNEEVGGVAGEKKIMQLNGSVTGAGEGLYWKYESFLKQLDWEFYTVVGAAGELFSLRSKLYDFPGDNVLLDDFILSLKVCRKGYRVAYEPEAYASETPSLSMKEEQKRKIRISAGAFQSMLMMKDLLNIFKYPRLAFQYISHRVLRWTLCPAFLPIIFVCNAILFFADGSNLYTVFMAAQLLFYLMAIAGWILSLNRIKIGFLYAPYYFVFINLSLYLGFKRFLKGKQTVIWEKASRIEYSGNNVS